MNNDERIKYLNEKHKEISDRQEKELYIDFDEALQDEQKKEEYITIKLLNKKYKIPSKMPFNFSTFFLRYCYKRVGKKYAVVMPEEKMQEFLELMLPKQLFIDIYKSKEQCISTEFIWGKIVPKIMSLWGYDINPEKAKELEKKMLSQG